MKKKLILGIIIFLFLTNCGFKIVNEEELYNFNIIEVNSKGDNKIAFFLKNNLKVKNELQNRKIKLDIQIKKNKSIKEKNIENQITKYEISLNLFVNYNMDYSNKRGSFSVSKAGDYTVEKQYSQTINRENDLIDTLSNSLIEEIKINLSKIVNDL